MRKRLLKLTGFTLFLVILLSNCAARVNYVGKRYSPSQEVDVYYSKEDINKEYEVMGHAIGSGDSLPSTNERIQRKLIEEAKSKGADGILITGIHKSIEHPDNDEAVQIKAEFIKYK
jgi:hypothetical protein